MLTRTENGVVMPSEESLAVGIMLVTQAVKPIFGEGYGTRFIPLLPLAISIFWYWAEAVIAGGAVDWPLTMAKAMRLFIMSVGVFAAMKQVVPKSKGE